MARDKTGLRGIRSDGGKDNAEGEENDCRHYGSSDLQLFTVGPEARARLRFSYAAASLT